MDRNLPGTAWDRETATVWAPVFLGLCIICGESTQGMGAAHTVVWLSRLLALVSPHSVWPGLQEFNHVLRKCGHFLGYGTLGILFARGWYLWLRRRGPALWMSLRSQAAMAGVVCTFVVASADEFHQRFLPGRGASFLDVLLDTSGALLLNAVFLTVILFRWLSSVEHQRTVLVVRRMLRVKAITATRRARRITLHKLHEFLRADLHREVRSNLDFLERKAA